MTQAKRILKDIDFSKEGCHIALTSKTFNGGPQNQRDVLMFKSIEKIEKAEVQVRLSMVDFLRKFFGLWYDEAETLADLLGYEVDTPEEYRFNSLGEAEVTLLKSAKEVENTEEALGKFVNSLSTEDLEILKSFRNTFENKQKEHTMSKEALEATEAELKKAQDELEELRKAQADLVELKKAQEELVELKKAKEEENKTAFIAKAKDFGVENSDELGTAMAVLSYSEEGKVLIKAIEDAYAKLDNTLEDETGLTGAADEAAVESGLRKAIKTQHKIKD